MTVEIKTNDGTPSEKELNRQFSMFVLPDYMVTASLILIVLLTEIGVQYTSRYIEFGLKNAAAIEKIASFELIKIVTLIVAGCFASHCNQSHVIFVAQAIFVTAAISWYTVLQSQKTSSDAYLAINGIFQFVNGIIYAAAFGYAGRYQTGVDQGSLITMIFSIKFLAKPLLEMQPIELHKIDAFTFFMPLLGNIGLLLSFLVISVRTLFKPTNVMINFERALKSYSDKGKYSQKIKNNFKDFVNFKNVVAVITTASIYLVIRNMDASVKRILPDDRFSFFSIEYAQLAVMFVWFTNECSGDFVRMPIANEAKTKHKVLTYQFIITMMALFAGFGVMMIVVTNSLETKKKYEFIVLIKIFYLLMLNNSNGSEGQMFGNTNHSNHGLIVSLGIGLAELFAFIISLSKTSNCLALVVIICSIVLQMVWMFYERKMNKLHLKS